jgi:hypothetical protein
MGNSASNDKPRAFLGCIDQRPNRTIIKGDWFNKSYTLKSMNAVRPTIHVWKLHRGCTSHWALGFSYETTVIDSPSCTEEDSSQSPAPISPPAQSAQRHFKAELLYNEDEVFLQYKGPNTNFKKYTKEHCLDLKDISMASIKLTCDHLFSKFGPYCELSNNCQHFVTRVLTLLVKEYENELTEIGEAVSLLKELPVACEAFSGHFL